MNIEELIEKIKHGAFVCASNQRLARHISSAYDSRMLLEGLKAWETPGVMELGAWLSSLLTERAGVGAGGPLLSEARARALWEEAVSRDPEFSKEVPYRNSFVKESFEAYCLLKEHKAALSKNNIYLSEEALALKRWSAAYERLLTQKGFICPSMTCFLASGLIEKGEIQLQGELIFAGFEEITPALATLGAAIENSGVRVGFWPDKALQDTHEGNEFEGLIKGAELYAFPDMREEVICAARWAREEAAQGSRVGVIVTNLTQYKELIEREFASELTPASALLDGAGSISEAFNISMAASLSESPLVKAALDLLSITEAGRPLETELMWEVIKSPYLHASEEEYFSLATLDARLRQDNRSEINLYSLSRELSREDGEALNSFKERVDLFIKALEKKPKGRSKEMPSVWAGRFYTDLKGFGWPDSMHELTSREFQAFEAFNDLLTEFAGLDDITGPLKRSEAAGRLVRMAEARTHQPKSPETLIEVIGISESIGFEFDSIWIVNANNEVLPPAIDPNPFIPVNMQRELGFTRACPELESKRARERIARLVKGAGKAVVSYPEMIDGKEVRVSPFFSSLPGVESAVNMESTRLKDALFSSSLLEDMVPEGAVGFSEGEKEALRGGTSILKDQSACPFKAFATYRLGAKVVESPEPGLSYMDRGTLLHSALKIFWEEAGGSEQLKKLIHEDKLIGQVKNVIEKVIEEYKKEKNLFREVHYFNLEKVRLTRLLLDWLTYEASREPFVVEKREAEDERPVSGLTIKFRIDRVDYIPNLGHAVIDYKSGICNRNDWLGTRPKDPQMLFYNLFGPYEALAFARVKTGKCKLEGIAKEEGMLPKNKGFGGDTKLKTALAADGIDSFDGLTNSWRKVVERLAKDFVSGVSVVDPNDWGNDKACIYCDLKPLCRIFEAEDSIAEEL